MIRIIYTVSGNPSQAAAQAAEFYALLSPELKEKTATIKPQAAGIAQAGELESVKAEYKAKFGERFRILDSQAGENPLDIMRACLEAGKRNKELHGGKAGNVDKGGEGETFDGEIDLEEPPED